MLTRVRRARYVADDAPRRRRGCHVDRPWRDETAEVLASNGLCSRYQPLARRFRLPTSVGILLRLCRLVRLAKLGRVLKLVETWSEASSVPYSYIDIARLVGYIVVAVHWVACAWGLMGELQRDSSSSWLDALADGNMASCAYQREHDAYRRTERRSCPLILILLRA